VEERGREGGVEDRGGNGDRGRVGNDARRRGRRRRVGWWISTSIDGGGPQSRLGLEDFSPSVRGWGGAARSEGQSCGDCRAIEGGGEEEADSELVEAAHRGRRPAW
jgi:hypothetical protein